MQQNIPNPVPIRRRGDSLLLWALIMLLLSGCGPTAPPSPPAPPEVTVMPVAERKVQNWDEYTGRLEAVDVVEIRPRVSGYIDHVGFTAGHKVGKGDLLFQIDARPYKAQHDQAVAELTRSRTMRDLGRIEYQRVQKMQDSGAVSREELDQRASALAQAEANVAAAQAAVDAAVLNLEFTRVVSPIDGRVSRAEVTRGNLVGGGPNGGTLLTTVVSNDPIYLYFEGDEHSYLGYSRLLLEGKWPTDRALANTVELGLADEQGFPHRGRLDFVDNRINAQTGTIRARAVFDNRSDLLRPGMFARLRMLASEEYVAPVIDDRAIGTDQSQSFVFVVGQDGVVAYRGVKPGRLIDGMRVVKEGLAVGEQVVVSGLHRIRPGAQVTVKLATAASQTVTR